MTEIATSPEVEIAPRILKIGGQPATLAEPTVWKLMQKAKTLKGVADKYAGVTEVTNSDMLDMLADEDTHQAAKEFLALFLSVSAESLDDLTPSEAVDLVDELIDSGLLARIKSVFTRTGLFKRTAAAPA